MISHPFNNLIEETYKDIQKMKNNILVLLRENGVETLNNSFEELIKELSNLKILARNKDYLGFKFNNEGYITEVIPIDYVIEDEELPEDVEYGYYKIENEQIVLDEERKRLSEEVL